MAKGSGARQSRQSRACWICWWTCVGRVSETTIPPTPWQQNDEFCWAKKSWDSVAVWFFWQKCITSIRGVCFLSASLCYFCWSVPRSDPTSFKSELFFSSMMNVKASNLIKFVGDLRKLHLNEDDVPAYKTSPCWFCSPPQAQLQVLETVFHPSLVA